MARILLIEDEPEFVTLLRIMLEYKGYQVDLTTDGREGIEMFAKHPYDVVVTDLFMPRLTGYELISQMKWIKPDVKIITITAGKYKTEHIKTYIHQAFMFGADLTLKKPILYDELIEQIDEMLAKKPEVTFEN